jgi:hypothetical protein
MLRHTLAGQFDAFARLTEQLGPLSTEHSWSRPFPEADTLGTIDPNTLETAVLGLGYDSSEPARKGTEPGLKDWVNDTPGAIGHCTIREEIRCGEKLHVATFVGGVPERGVPEAAESAPRGRPALRITVADGDRAGGAEAKWGEVAFGYCGPDGFVSGMFARYSERDLALSEDAQGNKTVGMGHIASYRHPNEIVPVVRECNAVLYAMSDLALASA